MANKKPLISLFLGNSYFGCNSSAKVQTQIFGFDNFDGTFIQGSDHNNLSILGIFLILVASVMRILIESINYHLNSWIHY